MISPSLVEQVDVRQAVGATAGLLKGQGQLGPQHCQVDLRLATVQAQLYAETLLDVGVHPPHYHCHVFTLGMCVGVKLNEHLQA